MVKIYHQNKNTSVFVKVMNSKADVDIQVLAIPGLRHASVTDFAIQKVEDRFDALYIMDIEERDEMNTVVTGSDSKTHVTNTVNSFEGRNLDTSFAAAYFPDVVITDPATATNAKGLQNATSVPAKFLLDGESRLPK